MHRPIESHQRVTPPDFTKHLKSCDTPEGTQIVLECHVTGIPSPEITWYRDDTVLSHAGTDYVITQVNGTCTLKIRRVCTQDSARYTCKAQNAGGEAATSARLNVISKDIWLFMVFYCFIAHLILQLGLCFHTVTFIFFFVILGEFVIVSNENCI